MRPSIFAAALQHVEQQSEFMTVVSLTSVKRDRSCQRFRCDDLVSHCRTHHGHVYLELELASLLNFFRRIPCASCISDEDIPSMPVAIP